MESNESINRESRRLWMHGIKGFNGILNILSDYAVRRLPTDGLGLTALYEARSRFDDIIAKAEELCE